MKKIIFTLYLFFAVLSSLLAQISRTKCELDGKLWFSNGKKYYGDCQNNKANGWGEIDCGFVVTRGLFTDNVIQDLFLEEYHKSENLLVIGPNKGKFLHGPCVSIYKGNSVNIANYENGSYRGSGDLFQIPKPDFIINSNFCDVDGTRRLNDPHLIPNTSNIICLSQRKYNTKGDVKYWISIVDLSTNQLIRRFGSAEKPLSFDTPPTFYGFTRDNSPVYGIGSRYMRLNISNGTIQPLNALPHEIINRSKFIDKLQSQIYKDYGSSWLLWGSVNTHYKLTDSSYVRIFNSNDFLNSVTSWNPKPGSGSSLVLYNKNHEVIKNLDFPNANIFAFDIDESNDRIALRYGIKDSTYLALYDLNTFTLISNVYSHYKWYKGNIKFSKTGSYLTYEVQGGAIVFLGNKIHYAVKGDYRGTNDYDNIIYTVESDRCNAYDLEKKRLIWSFKCSGEGDYKRTFFVDNKIYVLWFSYQDEDRGVKLSVVKAPTPLLNLSEFVKNPEETVSLALGDKGILNDKNNATTNTQINNSDESLMRVYFMLRFWAAILESSNKYSTNSSSNSNHSNPTSNGSSSQNCYSCNGTGNCSGGCTKTIKKPHYDGKCGWPESSEVKFGFILCSTCSGKGYQITNNQFKCDCRNGIGWCPEKKCYIRMCNNGWVYCKECNSNGRGTALGKCNECKGSGKKP